MENLTLEQLRYPIGQFECPTTITDNQIEDWILILEELPFRLERLVEGLSEEQLETQYRPEGWTVRQLVHHISDSHHHSYIRFKWALTEDRPIIKPYEEKGWSNLFDARTAPIQMSLDHLKVVHAKLVYFLKGLSRIELETEFIHPDGNAVVSLAENIGKYAWHGSHHFAHIEGLLERKGWK